MDYGGYGDYLSSNTGKSPGYDSAFYPDPNPFPKQPTYGSSEEPQSAIAHEYGRSSAHAPRQEQRGRGPEVDLVSRPKQTSQMEPTGDQTRKLPSRQAKDAAKQKLDTRGENTKKERKAPQDSKKNPLDRKPKDPPPPPPSSRSGFNPLSGKRRLASRYLFSGRSRGMLYT